MQSDQASFSLYLASATERFQFHKKLGEDAFAQLGEEQLMWQANASANSIAMIVKHLSGNMRSRWTDLLTTDGEKPWRKRDQEFVNDVPDRDSVMKLWDAGWEAVFAGMASLTPADQARIVYIRTEPHNLTEAINRQLTHAAYHVGQIVFLAKMILDLGWRYLSIAPGGSEAFNAEMDNR